MSFAPAVRISSKRVWQRLLGSRTHAIRKYLPAQASRQQSFNSLFTPRTVNLGVAYVSGRPISTNSVAENATDKVEITFVDAEGEEFVVQAKVGDSLLQVAHDNDIEIEGACGGELACSTCHVILDEDLYSRLPEPCEEEEDMLDLAWGLTDTSRLGCQVLVSKDMEGVSIRLPDETNNLM